MTEAEIRSELAAISLALTHNAKAIDELTIIILGKDGQGGCLRHHSEVAKDFYNFRLLIIIGLSSAGLFGGGGFWLSKLLGG